MNEETEGAPSTTLGAALTAPTPAQGIAGRPSRVVLTWALEKHREEVRAALEAKGHSRAVFLRFAVPSLWCGTLSLLASPEPPGEPHTLRCDVLALGDEHLEEAVVVFLTLDPARAKAAAATSTLVVSDADTLVGAEGVVWRRVAVGGREREVERLLSDGSPDFRDVDTTVYAWWMSCPKCGRTRYAKKNSIYQVARCRVCTRSDRLRERNVRQYAARRRAPSGGTP